MSARQDALTRLRNLMKRVRAPRGVEISVNDEGQTLLIWVIPDYEKPLGGVTDKDIHKAASEIERLLNKLKYNIKDVAWTENIDEPPPNTEYQFTVKMPVWSAALFYDGYAVDAEYAGTEEKARQLLKDLQARVQLDVVQGIQEEGKPRVASTRTASATRVAGRYRVAMLKVPRDRGALKALLKDFWQYGTHDGSFSELAEVLDEARVRGILRDDIVLENQLDEAITVLEETAEREADAYKKGWEWSKKHLKPLMDAL
jgi:hypothetical protein